MSIENRKILLQQLNQRFLFLTAADDAVETKSGVLLGFIVTIGLAFASQKTAELQNAQKLIELTLGLVSYVIAAYIIVFNILYSRTYGTGVVTKKQTPKRLQLTEEEFIESAIDDMQRSNDINAVNLKQKSAAFKKTIVFFIIGSCLLLLSTLPIITI